MSIHTKIEHDADERLKGFLHYMKGMEPFSKILRTLIRKRKEWCPFTHDDVGIDEHCYHSNSAVQAVIAYVRKYTKCCKYLDSHPFAVADLERACHDLSIPERMDSSDDFDAILKRVKDSVLFLEPDISSKLARFTCIECTRLDEAVECFTNYCFYASVVMSVSAVEARITEIVRRHDPHLYEEQFSKATLGQLVQLFDENLYKDPKYSGVKKLMPDRHKPLLVLLNQYRIFSAHPKAEQITVQIADAALKLCFTFMVDPDTCPYDEEELQCA